MNKLSTEERTQIVSALVEGNSMRSISRMTGASRNTIDKLLCDLGRACSDYQDKAFRNLKSKRLQCDEIWSFVQAKEKNCTLEMKKKGAGDVWTWVALDPDTKLVPCWFIGQRDAGCAYHFMHDLAERLAHRVQLTTDGHRAYLSAVEDAFGAGIDYAMLQKIYGASQDSPETRYSPAICMGAGSWDRPQVRRGTGPGRATPAWVRPAARPPHPSVRLAASEPVADLVAQILVLVGRS